MCLPVRPSVCDVDGREILDCYTNGEERCALGKAGVVCVSIEGIR